MIEGGVGYLNQQWQGQVYHFYREAVEGRFPFALQGRGEVAIDDFATMFKPQGRLDTFITKQLQPFVYWDNNTLKLAEVDGRKLPIQQATLNQLNQAKKISTIFFGPTGQQLAVKLKFRASSMSTSSTQFNVRENENIFTYRHGPRLWSKVIWPSIGANDYMSANFYSGENRIATKSYTGQWALFRLLFDGSSSATADRRIRKLHYGLEDQSIVFEYALDSSNSVLNKRLLNNFHLSSNL
ncbi:type VI secretion IcmF C-terminal domain-containing protein [Photobacterium sanguinicancri]|uniref:type VI secretion IcmF C-terminal domain-containing protein n=1 Tax=Photobacterium sanguinicancri TaxID=875932 RepID=UPI000A6C4EC3|nr:type VI secretion IcmF C-terminal domain-containing protein [Photobacterium sanguinicancri]